MFDLINRFTVWFRIQKQLNLKHLENHSIVSLKVHIFGSLNLRKEKNISLKKNRCRIVIFSKNPIVKVEISIDSKYLGDAVKSVDNDNLYVLKWNTSVYHDGFLHDLSVVIHDNKNQILNLQNQFSLSTTTITAWTKSKFILYIHWPTFVWNVFSLEIFRNFVFKGMVCLISTLCIYVLILTYYRFRSKRMTRQLLCKKTETSIDFDLLSACCTGCFSLWNKLRLRMMILCSIDLFYYSLIGLAVYHFIGKKYLRRHCPWNQKSNLGPWYIGYLTDGYFGVVFLWGLIIRGTYLPPDMQTFMGTIQLGLFLLPLTYTLSSSCYYRYNQLQTNVQLSESYWTRFKRIFTVYILFIYSFAFVVFWSYMTTASYKYAWILSPFGLILSLFSLGLYVQTKRLTLEHFRFPRVTNHQSDERLDDPEIDVNDQTLIIPGRRETDKDD